MNLDWYRVFFQLAKSKSFSKAADKLFVTQPAVSRTIAHLEDSLGCELFIRTRQGVILTEQGKILYENIENAFESISAAEKAIMENQTLAKGEIKFGASDTLFKYYLIRIIKDFNKDYPHIKFRVISGTTAKILNSVKNGDIDFGIIYLPVKNNKNLIFKPIFEEQDCFIVGKKFKHLAAALRHVKDIVEYPLILLDDSTNTRKHINNYFKNNLLSIVADYEAENTDLLVEYAKNNFGVACVCKSYIKDELDSGQVYEIPLYEKIPSREISVTWLSSVPLSVVSKAFIEKL